MYVMPKMVSNGRKLVETIMCDFNMAILYRKYLHFNPFERDHLTLFP